MNKYLAFAIDLLKWLSVQKPFVRRVFVFGIAILTIGCLSLLIYRLQGQSIINKTIENEQLKVYYENKISKLEKQLDVKDMLIERERQKTFDCVNQTTSDMKKAFEDLHRQNDESNRKYEEAIKIIDKLTAK